MKRISVCVPVILVAAVFLAGCLGGGISLEISPSPLVFSLEEQEVDLTVKARTTGFGRVHVDTISVIVRDTEEGETLHTQTKEVDEGGFVISGITFEETFRLSVGEFFDEFDDDYYYEELAETEHYEFEVNLTGSAPTSKKVAIIFE